MTFTEDYDPGFLNVPGFGQSATNPLAPVFYRSLGIVENLSVYDSIYAANSIKANVSFEIGESVMSRKKFTINPITEFRNNVVCDDNLRVHESVRAGRVSVDNDTRTRRLFVNGREYRPTRIKADNGTFIVLARV
jgi:hypothetical protein